MKEKDNSGSVIVSWSFSSEDPPKGVLIVGKKAPKKDVDIVNAFNDREAWDIYQKLFRKRVILDATES